MARVAMFVKATEMNKEGVTELHQLKRCQSSFFQGKPPSLNQQNPCLLILTLCIIQLE